MGTTIISPLYSYLVYWHNNETEYRFQIVEYTNKQKSAPLHDSIPINNFLIKIKDTTNIQLLTVGAIVEISPEGVSQFINEIKYIEEEKEWQIKTISGMEYLNTLVVPKTYGSVTNFFGNRHDLNELIKYMEDSCESTYNIILSVDVPTGDWVSWMHTIIGFPYSIPINYNKITYAEYLQMFIQLLGCNAYLDADVYISDGDTRISVYVHFHNFNRAYDTSTYHLDVIDLYEEPKKETIVAPTSILYGDSTNSIYQVGGNTGQCIMITNPFVTNDISTPAAAMMCYSYLDYYKRTTKYKINIRSRGNIFIDNKYNITINNTKYFWFPLEIKTTYAENGYVTEATFLDVTNEQFTPVSTFCYIIDQGSGENPAWWIGYDSNIPSVGVNVGLHYDRMDFDSTQSTAYGGRVEEHVIEVAPMAFYDKEGRYSFNFGGVCGFSNDFRHYYYDEEEEWWYNIPLDEYYQ